MANRIKGITVEIGGDTTKLSKALEGVNKNIKDTQSQLKDVQKLLKLDPTNTELLSQKHKLLADAVSTTKEKLQTLKVAAEQANTALAEGTISQGQYDALQREIIETENELKRLTTEANNSYTALEKLGIVGDTLQTAGDKISGAGKKLLPVTTGITALGTLAIKTGSNFDTAMSKVAAISGATGSEIDALREKAREMGSKTKFSASEAAEAMSYMAMAGWKTNDMLSGIEGIMNLAAASGEDLASTSDIVTDALTAFGLSASDSGHFADILAAASSNANTNVSMMGETFKYAAPVLGSLGYSAEDSAIAIGLMANAGIKSSQAGTALRSAITNLAKPTDTVAIAMEQYGISLTDSSGKMYSLRDLMGQLRQKLGGLSEAEQAQAAASLFGKEAMSGMLAIINSSSSDFNKLATAIDTSSDSVDGYNGTTEKMAAVMQDNLAGQLTILKSQLEELAISFSDILMPVIRSIVSHIQGLVDKLNQLDPQTKETIIKIALIAAALGPVLIVLGKTISSVGSIISIISKLPASLSAVSGALVVSLGAFAAIIAVIAALVAAFIYLWNTNDEFKSNIISIWEEIKNTFTELTQGITDRINALGFDFENFTEVLKAAWDGLCNLLAPIFEGVFQNISNIFSYVSNFILGLLDVFIGLFSGDWNQMWNGVKEIFLSIWNYIVSFFTTIINTLKNTANVILGWFGTSWDEVWTSIKTFFVDTWNSIKNFFIGILTAIKNFFVNTWTSIKSFFVNTWNSIKTFVVGVLTTIRDFFVNTWTKISNTITTIVTKIKTFITTVFTAIYNFFSTIFNAIYTVVSTIIHKVHDVIVTVWNAVYNTIKPLLDAFKYLFETIFQAVQILIGMAMDWISEKISAIWNAIVEFLTPILEGIKNTFETVWNGIQTAVDTVLTTIQNTVTSIWNAIVEFITPILEGIQNTFETVWNAIQTTIDTVLTTIHDTITSVWDTISTFVSDTLNTIWGTISSIWNNISTDVSNVLNTIKTTVTDLWDDIKGAISEKMDAIKEKISGIWDDIKSGASEKIGDIKTTITDGFQESVDWIKGLADEAVQWGKDIIQGIIDGINDKVNSIAEAATGVADTIRSYLHFSVPDVGPLTDYESWMPDFMNGLADGINKSKKVVAKAVSSVADAMQITMNSGLNMQLDGISGAMMNGSTGATVINNYNNDNSRTVNQTNNSPKSLSRLEIYRLTRNALNV